MTKHVHEFKVGKSGKVAVCRCGAFRFTAKGLESYPAVVEVSK